MSVSESFYLDLRDEVELHDRLTKEDVMHASMNVTMKCPACEGSMILFIVPDQHIHRVEFPAPKLFGMGKAYADCTTCKYAGKPYRFEAIFTVATTLQPEIFTEGNDEKCRTSSQQQ